MNSQIEERKVDHIRICLEENVQAQRKTTGFEDVFLVHSALPEIERKQIGLSTVVFKHEFSAPLLVGAMTGGTKKALKINAAIAEAVEGLGLGMGVGSQRVALEDHRLEDSFVIAREKAPTAFLVANIGGAQLVDGYGAKEARRALKMLEANALAIHLNPLQEAVQPEGETNYSGIIDKISEIVRTLEVPVIVKETGAGIATEEAKKLEEAGVAGIDVAGVGGTSWAAVEFHRAKRARDKFHRRLGQTFWDWGIPTASTLVEVARSVHIPVIASGGIRFGTEAAKSLALGASLVSMTSPILKAATKGPEEVKQTLQFVIEELRNTMFLVGAKSILKLQEKPVVLTGKTAEWLRMRGFKPELYARRKE